jgi:hypothetical protein
MGEVKENPNVNRDFIIAVVVLFGLGGYKYFEKNPINWTLVIYRVIFFFSGVIILIGIIMTIVLIYRHKKRKKEEFENFLSKLHKLNQINEWNYKIINDAKEKIRYLKKDYPKFFEKYAQDFKKLDSRIIFEIKTIENENNAKKELRKQNIEKSEKILEYFIKKDSCKIIPKWAINEEYYVINWAIKDFEDIKQKEANIRHEEYFRERDKEYAEEFILEHKGLPSDFHNFHKEKQKAYLDALERFEKGELKIKTEKEGFYKDEPFYLAKDLTAKERDDLIKLWGYKHMPFIDFDGKFGNQLFIKNLNTHESDYHFAMKHLFGNLNFGSPCMEYSFKGGVVDVFFLFHKKRVALEIETGTNKELFIEEKIKYLNKNYDKWIILTSRKNKKKYRKFIDNKKSFCLGVKEAHDFLQSLLSIY